MLKKITLLAIVIAAVTALCSGCLYVYMLDELIGGDDETEPMKDYVTSRGEIYDYEHGQGRYCEFDLNEEYVQNNVKITVYGAWFYDDIEVDDGEIKSFIDFYVGIENMSEDDMAFVYYYYSDVRLSTGETVPCCWQYSDDFEGAYEPGQYREGTISYEVRHTELSDLGGAKLRLNPLFNENGNFLRPTDPYIYEYNFVFIHDEYDKPGDIEFKSNVLNNLKLELHDFGVPSRTNFVRATDSSGPVTVTVPAVAVYKQHELDFGRKYDIVAVPVMYVFDTDEEVQFEPRDAYIICDGSRRIDCDRELCEYDCYYFLNGNGVASFMLYFSLKDKADADFTDLHFVISSPLDGVTHEGIGEPISMDFTFH